ncbi:protein kinase domain-containing protein [Plesiocystis pacifica]|nr:protein kinase [Plesiocystis pacifica]
MRGGDTRDFGSAANEVDAVQALLDTVVPDRSQRIRIEGEVARGGMASILAAIDGALQRRVAIKVLRPGNEHSMLAVRSFIREAQITGQLDHPNIVPVHELGVNGDGRLFFMMKLVEGRTFAALIDALRATHDRFGSDGLPVATAVEHDDLLRLLDVFAKVLDAVAFAHSRGVIHLDLKPENVMVGDYGQVYLMDWGIAKVLPPPAGLNPYELSRRVKDTLPLSAARETVIMGTPAYMSPEQARGEHRSIDERTDVFALGAMLFEILTGHPPYRGTSAVEVLMQAEEGGASLPDDLPVPRELRRILAKAMAVEPRDRYLKVEELQRDVQRFRRGGGDFPRQKYAPGDWIIREDEVGDAAYIILTGSCEVFKSIDGRWESLRKLHAGEVFGETAILASTPRTASVVALTEVTCVVVTREVLESEVDAMKPWMGAFIRALAQRFSEGEEKRRMVAMGVGIERSAHDIANSAMMILGSWGKWDRDLGSTMGLGRLVGAVKSSLGSSQDQIIAGLAQYERFFVLDDEHDTVSLRDARGLRKALGEHLRF